MPSPRDLAQTLAVQFNYTSWVFNKTLESVTHEESLTQPVPAGNCLNWVAGHITGSRMGILELLGRESVWEREWRDRYKRGSDAVTGNDGVVDFADIVHAFNTAQDLVISGLPELTQERLDEPAPFSPANDPNETIGSLLAGLAFHESYHCGQLGTLRRLLGKGGVIK